MPPTEAPAAPAQAALPAKPDGEQPPAAAATPVAKDERSKEERARALLQGEPPKDAAPDLSEEASIDSMFDPETGELIEDEPEPSGEQPTAEEQAEAERLALEAAETPEAKAEREEQEEQQRLAEEKKKGEPKRIRINREKMGDRDFAIIRLMDDQGISYHDAEKRLFGDTVPKPAEPAPAAEPSKVDTITAKIAEVMAQRDEAAESMDAKKANKFNDQLIDLQLELRDVKHAEQSRVQIEQQTTQQRFETAEASAIARAAELYPEATTKGSALMEALNAKATALHAEDPGFFKNPKWPLTLAVDTATELGIAAKVKGEAEKPAPAKPAAQIIVPKKTVRPAPAQAPGTATSTPTNTEATLRAELAEATKNRDVEGIRNVLRKATDAHNKR